MYSTILKLIDSIRISYLLLFLLAIAFISVDFYCDRNELNSALNSELQSSYSDYMSARINDLESKIFEDRLGPVRKKGLFDDYLKISKFYYDVKNSDSNNSNQRMRDAMNVLGVSKGLNKKEQIIGVDFLDRDELYFDYLSTQSFSRNGCGPGFLYEIYSNYDIDKKVYFTRLVKTVNPRQFVLTYRNIGYQMSEEPINLNFSKDDVDNGYADVTIRDRSNGNEFQHRLVINKYAFRA